MSPLDQRDLDRLRIDLESDRVERKESAADANKLRRNICAFANDLPGHALPGVVFIGVKDDGGCADSTIDDRLLTKLAAMKDDGNIMPMPSLVVQKHTLSGCEVAATVVEPSRSPPVRFRGRVWVRVGPTVRQAAPEEEQRLSERRSGAERPFDQRPAQGATAKDLTDPIRSQKVLTGRLDDVLRQLDELLKLNISVRTEVATVSRERRSPDYPVAALQQLARNGVMHRSYEGTNAPVQVYWYSDRVEIRSPGGLYGRVTPDNFGSGAVDHRNPLVAEIMHYLGFAQRFGLGIPLARRELRQNGNPEPEFDFGPTHVVVTVEAAS